MDGSTWRRYRLVTSRGDEPPFFLEPDNPGDWPQHFAAAGFDVLSRYCSTRLDDLGAGDARMPQALQRLGRAGVTIRPIDLSRFEEELRQVHTLSLDAFAGNFLYTPIRCEQFLAMYRPLREHLRRETVLLAEQAGELLGFVFGIPDLAQAQRGEAVDTIIIKTVAVRPGVRLAAGLGSILVDQCQQAAKRLGMGRAIHALMHENNRSRQIARGGGRLIREYALFARRLTP
ncbi:MAG: GNAT family N-acetyltransferase [Phycisphaeraceae bacterium]